MKSEETGGEWNGPLEQETMSTKQRKEYWVTNSRFKYIGLLLLIIFLVFMFFLYMKADEITKDPCAICAEYMGDKVTCLIGTSYPVERIYYPNGSMEDNLEEMTTRARQDSIKGFELDVRV